MREEPENGRRRRGERRRQRAVEEGGKLETRNKAKKKHGKYTEKE